MNSDSVLHFREIKQSIRAIDREILYDVEGGEN